MLTMILTPSPMSNTEQQAQLATDELIATAQALIDLGAPTVSPEAFHGWLGYHEDLGGFPTNDWKTKT